MKVLRLLAISAMVVGALLLGTQSNSHALMKLWLGDGTNTVIITDELAGDLFPGVGTVTFAGAIGNWIVNVTTGISYPVLGGPGIPYIDLNSVNVTSPAGGNLTIGAAQTGFTLFDPITGQAGPFNLSVGGTTAGTVDFDVWLNRNNLYPWDDGNNLIFDFLAFNTSPFSGSISGVAPGLVFNPYSLTIRADIAHNGSGSTSFDVELTKVPEPGILILLGIGLSVVGVLSRRIKF